MKHNILIIILIFIISARICSQVPQRFQKEIDSICNKFSINTDSHNLIVFTGSSSVRRWKDISGYFPGKNIINTGFGGSQMSDLLFYSDSVITRYRPVQVFIYEGDNDIAAGEKAGAIIKEAEILCSKLKAQQPRIQIVFLAAKPSPLRWAFRDEYLKLNSMFSKMASRNRGIKYVDVWSPLLSKDGRPIASLYIKDSLHINNQGYKLWYRKIKKIIK